MPDPPDQPIVFFDGECNLCNRLVDTLLRLDSRRRLRLAPLHGDTADDCLNDYWPDADQRPDSIVYLGQGEPKTHSSAVVATLRRVGGIWRLLGGLLWLVPKPVRDALYRYVARHREDWFGRSCRLPTEEEEARLLP